MDSTINSPYTASKRRSSIFKLEYEDEELVKELNFPVEYVERLEQEKDDWINTLQAITDKWKQLKSKIAKQKDSSIKIQMQSEDLEFFDQAFYYDCLRSVQHVCTKFECLMNKKEQQEFTNEKNRNNILSLVKGL